MASLSTHILDTEHGEPARGALVTLQRRNGNTLETLGTFTTNHDGRVPSFSDSPLPFGDYLLSFDLSGYFATLGGEPSFMRSVTIEFSISTERHYHVPLLASRYSCSSYRGS
jgi:5-hydroxyisourate hydrolase